MTEDAQHGGGGQQSECDDHDWVPYYGEIGPTKFRVDDVVCVECGATREVSPA